MSKTTLLLVDDAPENLDMLEGILSDEYNLVEKTSGYDALDYLNNSHKLPKMVLLDIRMPGIDGYQVLETMQADTRLRKIPVIVLTGSSSERRALESGAVDYVAKPFHAGSIKKRIQNQILIHSTLESLELEVQRQVKRNNVVWNGILEVMAEIIECRNNESGQHVKRTVKLFSVLMNDLLDNSKTYSDELMQLNPDSILKGVPLHDLGKVGIPDSVLMKPGALTAEEFEIMKTHTTIGMHLVERMMEGLDRQSDDLVHCRSIAYEHHERFDGKGYPRGLAGEGISLPARIMTVVDVYDALTNKRVYKEAVSHEEAMGYLTDNSRTHFDPQVVLAAQRVQDKFKDIECDYRK